MMCFLFRFGGVNPYSIGHDDLDPFSGGGLGGGIGGGLGGGIGGDIGGSFGGGMGGGMMFDPMRRNVRPDNRGMGRIPRYVFCKYKVILYESYALSTRSNLLKLYTAVKPEKTVKQRPDNCLVVNQTYTLRHNCDMIVCFYAR